MGAIQHGRAEGFKWARGSGGRPCRRYSALIASMGRIRAARRPGTQLARMAEPSSRTPTPANVATSLGLTSNSIVRKRFASRSVTPNPIALPIAAYRIPRQTTSRVTAPGCAPSARRTPISRRRWRTVYEIVGQTRWQRSVASTYGGRTGLTEDVACNQGRSRGDAEDGGTVGCESWMTARGRSWMPQLRCPHPARRVASHRQRRSRLRVSA